LNPKLKDFVLVRGRKIIKRIQVLMGRYSLVDTEGLRGVLFMDVLRPLPYLVSLLNRMIIKAIAASSFIRDAKRNHEAWERRMSQLWN
jgi:hypothetical protein